MRNLESKNLKFEANGNLSTGNVDCVGLWGGVDRLRDEVLFLITVHDRGGLTEAIFTSKLRCSVHFTSADGAIFVSCRGQGHRI